MMDNITQTSHSASHSSHDFDTTTYRASQSHPPHKVPRCPSLHVTPTEPSPPATQLPGAHALRSVNSWISIKPVTADLDSSGSNQKPGKTRSVPSPGQSRPSGHVQHFIEPRPFVNLPTPHASHTARRS